MSKKWRTPTCADSNTTSDLYDEQFRMNGQAFRPSGAQVEYHLGRQVIIEGGGMRDYSFPTPGTTGFCNGSGNVEKANTLAKEGVLTEEERVSFRAGNGGQLNPDWTEWLMDWPIGWTDLKPMSKEAFEDWRYRVSNCQWNEYDPAEFSKDSPAYIPRLTEDKTHRADRLKAIGNGQVPLCVYFATQILIEAIRNRA